jgi:hypothetical protein
MRKSGAAAATATIAYLRTVNRARAPLELVCLALALAVVMLAFRIASIW